MTGATMKLDLPYVYRQVDRYGKARFYFRRNSTKTPLPNPASEGFHAAYAKLIGSGDKKTRERPKAFAGAPGSLKWLCDRYFQTAEFKSLAPGTQSVRKNLLNSICLAEWRDKKRLTGTLPFAKMEPLHVREIKDEKSDFPEAANGRVKALRQLFAWAKKAGHVTSNPAMDVEYVHRRTDGHHTWTVEEVYQYWERWPLGTREYLALTLMLFTGARRGDAPRLGKGMERDGSLTFVSQKTKTQVTVPIAPMLREAIDACPSGHMTYLVTAFGQPFSAAGFGNWFGERCRKAGVPGRAHGLRKACSTILADSGATAHELMAIGGWSSLKEAELYTRKANRANLAKSGMDKLTHNWPVRKAE